MKNKLDFKFFVASFTLTVAALSVVFPVSALAQSTATPASSGSSSAELPGISGDIGMSQKSTSVYRRLSRRALRSLQENKDPFFVLGQGEATSVTTRLEFEQYCMDTDHSDVVSWQSSKSGEKDAGPAITKITFSCVLDSEYPKVQERLFVFSYEIENRAEAPRLADIQIAAANIVTPEIDFDKAMAGSSNSILATPEGKVAVAISGAVLSSGASAMTEDNSGAKSPADAGSNVRSGSSSSGTSVGKGALLAGLSAALSHFVFDVAPKSSGLSGGALSIVVEDLQQKQRKGLPPAFSSPGPNPLNKSGQSPITVYLTFKF